MRIFFANLKGGCGKTTAAVTLAVAGAASARAVCLIDADRQASATMWLRRRPPGLPRPRLITLRKLGQLRRIEGAHEVLIIDCRAGLEGEELAEHLKEGDRVFVPVLPSMLDLDATLAFLRGLRSAKKVTRGKVEVLPFLNRVRPRSRAAERVREALAAAELRPFAEIRESSAYALAAFFGKTPFDYHSAAAVDLCADWAPWLRDLRES